MTVEYETSADIAHLTADEVTALKTELDRDRWYRDGWYIDGTELTLSGSCEVDSYCTTVEDVAYELQSLLWQFDIDADVKTHEVEYEPDWDKMPGGVDYY